MDEPLKLPEFEALRSLRVAEGFCDLGMWEDAWSELETLGPAGQNLVAATVLRIQILIGLARFDQAAAQARGLIARGVEDEAVYLLGAYAVRRCDSLSEAECLLQSGEELLKTRAIFHYNLACYACVAGRLDEAREKLEKAFRIDAKYRALAVEDKDLQALWDKL